MWVKTMYVVHCVKITGLERECTERSHSLNLGIVLLASWICLYYCNVKAKVATIVLKTLANNVKQCIY